MSSATVLRAVLQAGVGVVRQIKLGCMLHNAHPVDLLEKCEIFPQNTQTLTLEQRSRGKSKGNHQALLTSPAMADADDSLDEMPGLDISRSTSSRFSSSGFAAPSLFFFTSAQRGGSNKGNQPRGKNVHKRPMVMVKRR